MYLLVVSRRGWGYLGFIFLFLIYVVFISVFVFEAVFSDVVFTVYWILDIVQLTICFVLRHTRLILSW